MHALIPVILLAAAWAQTAPAGEDDAPADPSPIGRRWIYFPPQHFDPNDLRRIEGPGWRVWTDAPNLDADRVRADLEAAEAFLAALPVDRPGPTSRPAEGEPLAGPIVSAVYARQADFVALWRRVGRYYGGRFFGVSRAGGYSYRVFCATWVDADAPGAVPAELAHEWAHLWLWGQLELANDGSWLSEALATLAQWAARPPSAADRAEHLRRVEAGRFIPLRRLLALRPARTDAYWQLATLVEMLLAEQPELLAPLIEAVNRKAGPAELLSELLQVDSAALTARWRAHCRRRAAEARESPGETPETPDSPATD